MVHHKKSIGSIDLDQITPSAPYFFNQWIEGNDANFGGKPEGVLPVGSPAKVGIIDGELFVGKNNDTEFKASVQSPYNLSRPLYIDPLNSHHAVIYIRSTGGGISENDRLFQKYICTSHTSATITTQAATNVHRMNTGYGSSWLQAEIRQGAYIEFIPDHTTLFRGSRFLQRQDYTVESGGVLVATDILAQGRLAGGEKNLFDCASSSVRITWGDTPILSENVALEPERTSSLLGQNSYPVWLNFYAVFPESTRFSSQELVDIYKRYLAAKNPKDQDHQWLGGVSELPYSAGSIIRVGTYTINVAKKIQAALCDLTHAYLTQESNFDLRIM